MDTRKHFLIIGAGPAGLTAARELLRQGCTSVTIVEQEAQVGGISKTVHYKGNCIDLGGHRFFSKTDEIMNWWTAVLPVEDASRTEERENVFLLRHRLSRILYDRKYFSYPVTLSLDTLSKLGCKRLIKIGFSYLHARIRPIQPEQSLEDFFINRFGRELYKTFFRDYTQKVWGIACSKLSADWGAQRVKGLSVSGVLLHAARSLKRKLTRSRSTLAQKDVETSLIEHFLYPKYGPGSLWEEVARDVQAHGARLMLATRVTGLHLDAGGTTVTAISLRTQDGTEETLPCDAVISSMPLRELVAAVRGPVPARVAEVAKGLVYRDFMTVGLVLRKNEQLSQLKDNWIYVQEPDVLMGRIQIFNNWSPWLVADRNCLLLGLEYFCTEGDTLWTMQDDDFIRMATSELEKIHLAGADDVLDAFVVRVPKAYPAYFGSYAHIHVLQDWLNGVHNLYPVGRNGMHRYNNMDHSMLSALRTVDCILRQTLPKKDIWLVNAEKEYHESK